MPDPLLVDVHCQSAPPAGGAGAGITRLSLEVRRGGLAYALVSPAASMSGAAAVRWIRSAVADRPNLRPVAPVSVDPLARCMAGDPRFAALLLPPGVLPETVEAWLELAGPGRPVLVQQGTALARMVSRFPRVPFVVLGGAGPEGVPFLELRPNVWLETSGRSPGDIGAALERAPERVVFGSGCPRHGDYPAVLRGIAPFRERLAANTARLLSA